MMTTQLWAARTFMQASRASEVRPWEASHLGLSGATAAMPARGVPRSALCETRRLHVSSKPG